MFSEVHKRVKKAGQPPGTPIYTGHTTSEPIVTVTSFSANEVKESSGNNLQDCLLSTGKLENIWVNVIGLSNINLIKKVAEQFQLHPLTVEDILNVEQRPKVEEFTNYIFITVKILCWDEKPAVFRIKQLSMILGKQFFLTFQESESHIFNGIRSRLKDSTKQQGKPYSTDYLMYQFLDAVVDGYFVVLEVLGDKIENLEEVIIENPSNQKPKTIYRLKRQMLRLRKAIWPMREVLNHLMHVRNNLISDFTSLYIRDVYDHVIQGIDSLETSRDMLSSLLDMYLSSLTNKMNEIMKTLTIISTIFIPITAIASFYGMNFGNLPGIHNSYGFFLVFFLMLAVTVFMLFYFRRKKWI